MDLGDIITEKELKEKGFEDMYVAFTDLRIYGKENQRLMLELLGNDRYKICEIYEIVKK